MSYSDMVKDLQQREAARRAGPPPNPEADALRRRLVAAEHEIAKLNEQLRLARADAPMRPSLEVLQRMANGLDQFDHNRFKAAVAALQFETPKLSMSASQSTNSHFHRYSPENTMRIFNETHQQAIEQKLKDRNMEVIK